MPYNPSRLELGRCYTLASARAYRALPTLNPERRLLVVLDVGRRLAISRGLIAA